MSPEYLPHLLLLLAGTGAAVVALHRLANRNWGSAIKLGALGFVLTGIAILGGRYASWKYSQTWYLPESMRPRGLSPAMRAAPVDRSEEPGAMTLALGGVRLRVMASDRYEMSVADETFLTVESDSLGLLVSCDVAATTPSRTSARVAEIRQNTIMHMAPYIRSRRPDPHTILVLRDGTQIFRVHYPDPRTLEVEGEIPLGTRVLRMREGIAWPSRFIPPGPVDLTAQGSGRIDLQLSGMIRVVPE
ncbi:MAG TPA: hypothetical protein VFP58_09995 [Candidatus Eisenbacteria bacterium]|nr:hypothetical protein [Candidatus Eisenbacteria bacterium]